MESQRLGVQMLKIISMRNFISTLNNNLFRIIIMFQTKLMKALKF